MTGGVVDWFDDWIIAYGLSGAQLVCPSCRVDKMIELPYPSASVGEIRQIAKDHRRSHRRTPQGGAHG